ncbi:hypothetical protein F5878DRAFT_389504 [Lentinula raphanica]|uniref:Uncharacterized protein n=1 Tax=Lentinula raphanica TaxID=153919 RepID=A0AA38UNB2_9AGAR|nr:hypothetical protein F5878DRAFT_389504 [Lentinula raphanica]
MSLATPETPQGSAQFMKHPDYQPVFAFLLGWVFYASFFALVRSMHVKRIFVRLWSLLVALTRLSHASKTSKYFAHSPRSKVDLASDEESESGDNAQQILITMLLVSFNSGSLTSFGSLLSFHQHTDLCDFLVVWSLLSLDVARLMGLFALLLALRDLGMNLWELRISLIWMFIGLVFVFANAALAGGVTQSVDQLGTTSALCLRKHFFPTSVVMTSIYFLLETFVIIRLWFLLPRRRFGNRRLLPYVADIRVLRAISLGMLELLTFVPSAIVTNTLGEFVPYGLGGMLVLLAFSHETVKDQWDHTEKRLDSAENIVHPSPVPSSKYPFSTQEDIRRFSIPDHFGANYYPYCALSPGRLTPLLNPKEDQRIARNGTTRSSQTIDSGTARSIREAVIHQATLEKISARTSYAPSFVRGVIMTPDLALPRRTLRPLRPKLTIVTQTSHRQSQYPIARNQGNWSSGSGIVDWSTDRDAGGAPAQRNRTRNRQSSFPRWTAINRSESPVQHSNPFETPS